MDEVTDRKERVIRIRCSSSDDDAVDEVISRTLRELERLDVVESYVSTAGVTLADGRVFVSVPDAWEREPSDTKSTASTR